MTCDVRTGYSRGLIERSSGHSEAGGVALKVKLFRPRWKTYHPLVMNKLLPLLDTLLSNQQLCFPRLLFFLGASGVKKYIKKNEGGKESGTQRGREGGREG